MYRLRRGMGDTLIQDAGGNVINCSTVSGFLGQLFNPSTSCMDALAAAQEGVVSQVSQPILPAPPQPAAPTVPPQVYQQQPGQPDVTLQTPAGTVIDQSIAGGVAQTQAQNQAFFNQLPGAACSSTIAPPLCNSAVYIGAAVVVGVLLLVASLGKVRR